jgi:hypothetical protein
MSVAPSGPCAPRSPIPGGTIRRRVAALALRVRNSNQPVRAGADSTETSACANDMAALTAT